MIKTDADNYFARMEEAAHEVLGAMAEQKENAYPGTLLTQITPIEGKDDDIFLPPLKVGEVHTIESILRSGNYGYAYFYKKSNEPPAVFLMTMTPESIANYLGAHQYDCYKMILSDKFDVQILDTIGGFINHCADRELCQKILPHLVPIQQCKKRPEPILMATYDAFDAYNFFVDMLSEGRTVDELKEAARAAGHEV